MTEPLREGGRRETRLLLATIAVSVGMLLLMARFRFPEEAARRTVEPVPAPLERLAARATFDELAGIMADLERRILPTLLPVAGQSAAGTIQVPAVRVTPDRAVALLPGDRRLAPIGPGPAPALLLRDAVRELIVVATPPRSDGIPSLPATTGRPGPRYVAVVDAIGGRPSVRPVYIGRTDLFPDPRWSDPLLSVAAGQALSAGSAVFSLDAAFIGLAEGTPGRFMIVPAATLREVAVAAPASGAARAVLRLDVQTLTPDLAKAAGADKGVMVSWVPDPSSPLSSGDVIRSMDGIGVTTVAGFDQVAQSRTPGAAVRLEIIRRGQPRVVSVTAVAADTPQTPRPGRDMGAVLRTIPGLGAEVVTVEPGGAADRAGLRRGDVILAIDGTARAESAALDRQFLDAKAGQSLLLTVRRDGEHRMVALEKQ